MKKQFIAKLLVFCLVLTMLPAAAFAADTAADVTPFTKDETYKAYQLSANGEMKKNITAETGYCVELGTENAPQDGKLTLTTNAYTLAADTVYVNALDTKLVGSTDGSKVGKLKAKTVSLYGDNKLDLTYVNLLDATTFEITEGSESHATLQNANLKVTGGAHGTIRLTKGVYAIFKDCTIRSISGGVKDKDYKLEGTARITGGGGGGSSAGGGAGGGATTPTTPSTTTAQDTNVPVKATVSGNTATASIPAETANKAVTDAIANKSENIIFSVTDIGDATKVEVTLPASSAKDIASKTSANVVIETPVATVTLSNAAVGELSAKASTSVGVTAEKNEDGTTTVTVLVDNKAVDKVSGVKAALPVTSAQSATMSTVVVLVNEDGTETIIKKSALKDGAIVAALTKGTSKLKVVDNAKSFADAPTQSWAKSAMDFVTSRELFQGVSATQFAPNSPMNRAMLVTVLYRLEDATSKGGAAFADVASGTWYTDAVGWATQAGITNGTGAGFNPNGEITRQDLATMLYRYAKSIGMDTTASGSTSSFADSGSVAGYASEAMAWAVGAGIINGSNGNLMPTANATRAEVSAMLMRLVGNM